MEKIDQIRNEIIQKFDGDLSLISSQIVPKIYWDNKILIPKGRTLVFMCAPSGSGKSTFCSKYFNELKDVKVISSDEILRTIVMAYGYPDTQISTEKWYKALQDNLLKNYVVVSDSNNVLVEMRALMLDRLKLYYDQTVMIVLDIPIGTILDQLRNRNPDSDMTKSVYERIFLDIQLENPKKYFAGIDKVCVVNDVSKVQIILTERKT